MKQVKLDKIEPEWPGKNAATVLLNIVVDKSIEDFVALAYCGNNEFKKRFNETTNARDYHTTAWVDGLQHLESASSTTENASTPTPLHTGMVRRANFATSSTLGGNYTSKELWQVVEAVPTKRYVLILRVTTTAPYGDKFTAIVKHQVESHKSTEETKLKISVALVFTGSVNGLVKSMIRKGAKEGMNKSFNAWKETLGKYAKVKDVVSVHHAAGSRDEASGTLLFSSLSQPSTGASGASGGSLNLATLVGSSMIESINPWAQYLHSLLPPMLGGIIDTHVMLCLLCLVISMTTLRLVLEVLTFLKHASAQPQDTFGLVAHYLLRFIYIPDSISQILTSCLLVFIAREINSRLITLLPPSPPPIIRNDNTSSNPTSPQQNRSSTEAEEFAQGLKYDGYSEALENATASITTDELGLSHSVAVGELNEEEDDFGTKMTKHSEAALVQIRKGLQTVTKGVAAMRYTPLSSATTSPRWFGGDHDESNSSSDNHVIVEPPIEIAPYIAPNNLPHEVMTEAIVDEIFENQRLQPFRGWGSTWPGHFLPTDKLLRWSTRDVVVVVDADTSPSTSDDTTTTITSQEFGDIVPLEPPEGYEWVEPAWRLDLGGLTSGCVDKEGWSYGLDFNWVTFPFQKDTGRKTIKDFVRRRRWLRTRIPIGVEHVEEEPVVATEEQEIQVDEAVASDADGTEAAAALEENESEEAVEEEKEPEQQASVEADDEQSIQEDAVDTIINQDQQQQEKVIEDSGHVV